MASNLASVLLEDKTINELVQTNEFSISLSPKYELTIRHVPHPEEVVVPE
jgi:hypothetical protein